MRTDQQWASRARRVGAAAALALGAGCVLSAPAQADVRPNIIGGQPATENYGFIASLQTDKDGDPNHHACGGSLIGERWVVTAAHCVTEEDGTVLDPADLHINIGSNDRNGGTEIDLDDIQVHPDWDNGELSGDIAVVRLAEKADVEPVEIADEEASPGDATRLVGWGRTDPENEGPLPTELRQLDTTVVDSASCAESDITDGEICTDNVDNAGPCGGDSGGPALIKDGDRWRLIGATSRNATKLCAASPEVFSSVPYFTDWIGEVTGGEVTAS